MMQLLHARTFRKAGEIGWYVRTVDKSRTDAKVDMHYYEFQKTWEEEFGSAVWCSCERGSCVNRISDRGGMRAGIPSRSTWINEVGGCKHLW